MKCESPLETCTRASRRKNCSSFILPHLRSPRWLCRLYIEHCRFSQASNLSVFPTSVITMTETGYVTTSATPIITAMEAGNGSTTPKQKPPPNSKRRRKLRCCCFATALVLGALAIVILVLALTIFRTRTPKTTVVSARVIGVSPRVSLPAVRIQLNITLLLLARIHNPNYASFQRHVGKTLVFYRGMQIGEAEVEPGRIPSRGSADVQSRLNLEADNLLSELGNLISDVLGGEVGLDSRTRIPGRVTILGIFKRHAVSTVNCHVAVGFPSLKIQRQDCQQKTKT